MSRNNPTFQLSYPRACVPIGGQAVLNGVMMRNGEVYGLAVRTSDGRIIGQRLPWRLILTRGCFRWPFIRGFPILLETLVNGIQAMNRAAQLADSGAPANRLVSLMSVMLAFLMALGLFIIAPHLLSLLMLWIGAGGNVDGFSFHIWDGFYKLTIFLAYIGLISLVPDIRKVFEYHGAEHKVVHSWENGLPVGAEAAFYSTRLHPRCGTTFLLFVISLSIIIQAAIVPACLHILKPENAIFLHLWSLAVKLILILPVSACSYELIKFAAGLPAGLLRNILQTPGLLLQRITTREPSIAQLQVALVALAEALDSEDAAMIDSPDYEHIEHDLDAENTACITVTCRS